MKRLGEILADQNLLTAAQLEQALRAQVLWGGRLGTILIELGFLDLDVLSAALGRQHDRPAALGEHFEAGEPALQAQLSATTAERYGCMPLYRVAPDQVVIVAAEPLEREAIATIAGELALAPDQIIAAIAAELRMRYQLERVYRIQRDVRFLRARGTDTVELPSLAELAVDEHDRPIIAPRRIRGRGKQAARGTRRDLPPRAPRSTREQVAIDENQLAPLPETPAPAIATTGERRTYASVASPRASAGRIPIPQTASATPVSYGTTVGEVTRAIRRSADRGLVVEQVVSALSRCFPDASGATVFVVRGASAVSCGGFVRATRIVPEIAIPIDEPGFVPLVIDRNTTLRGPRRELLPEDALLLDMLDGGDRELAVVPISVGVRVIGVIAIAIDPDARVATAESIAVAAGAAFGRLMREASRLDSTQGHQI